MAEPFILNRKFPIPGFEKHPDLQKQLDRALTAANCKACDRPAVIKKYLDLVERREARFRKHP